ncbi:D-glycerate dehydrogenase [Sphingobium fuliginis]|uniref:D-glycerate dehydrogenase n=1 Tax=Sphingobium fuliginis (strain ATCC 27551) TaxID=336203 RepID=A0A7M2GMD2_SPHSA|nr:D-glycerate dehydrogenase [Sphingobium fuliginis]QOT73920.1 D-glycerate dehydrogenase [Sphingobium fuliginis]
MAFPSLRSRILVTQRLPDAVEDYLRKQLGARLSPDDSGLNRAELEAAMCNHDIILATITDRFDAELLAMAERTVKLIANFGTGVDHIDLAAAQALGIMVTNTPDALTEATAELALLLMLTAARRGGEGERELRSGQWAGWRPTHMMGMGLAGRTLGLVGFGRIAQCFGLKAQALGMNVRYYSRRPFVADNPGRLVAERVDTLAELAASSDVLSLHVPGGQATHHLIDANILSVMKPHSILVNTARGPVVDEAALAHALEEGVIGAAALDVYEREPTVNPRLLRSERSVFLPHMGSATIEARTAMGFQATRNIEAFLRGEAPPNRVA